METKEIKWEVGFSSYPRVEWPYTSTSLKAGNEQYNFKKLYRNVLIGFSVTILTLLCSAAAGLLFPPLAFPFGMGIGCLGMFAFLELKL